MYSRDERGMGKIAERLLVGVVGGICGYFLGSLVGYLTFRLFGSSFGLAWWVAAMFGFVSFLAPSIFKEVWTQFLEGATGVIGGKK